MSDVLLLSAASQSADDVLPSLSLLTHDVRLAPPEAGLAQGLRAADAILVDARRDLAAARQLARQLRGAGLMIPLLAIVTEGAWAAVSADWGVDDLVLHTAGPGEVEARLRLAIGRATERAPEETGELRSGDLVISEVTYSARIHGRSLDLTFKEFELLKFLAHNPGRVFTRSQLLQEVWGYDYFGGTRTVDVHVRRLRAKLGAGNEALIGTVRNVGYRFVPARADSRSASQVAVAGSAAGAPPAQGPESARATAAGSQAAGSQAAGSQAAGSQAAGAPTGPRAGR